jgi:hypothetical protein
MQTPTERIHTTALASKLRAPTRTHLCQLLSAFAAWWADESMSSRFNRERARDKQVARRNTR